MRKYARVALQYDDKALAEKDRLVLMQLWEAADPIGEIFWRQVCPDFERVSRRLEASPNAEDKKKLEYFRINYGPFDRIHDYHNFLDGSARPPGAALYPEGMTSLQFEEFVVRHPALKSRLGSATTLVRRKGEGLEAIAYEKAYASELARSARHLNEAAAHSDRPEFARYLRSRAQALVQGDYRQSDRLWVSLRDQPLDIVIGPMEVSEDQLLGVKGTYEAAVLIRDETSNRDLNKFSTWAERFLSDTGFHRTLADKQNSEAWQVALFCGGFDAGVKIVATTLPNDEEIRRESGSRKLIFSNVLRAKFEKVLRPLAERLFDPAVARNVTEASLFQQALLHESCHAFQAGENRKPLANTLPVLDELKADLLALHVASRAQAEGLISADELKRIQTCYIAGVLRSIRLGVGNEYAQANAIALDHLLSNKAVVPERKVFAVNVEKLEGALRPLLESIREIDRRADYAAAKKLIEEKSRVPINIQRRLIALDFIPVDVAFDYRRPAAK